MMMERIRRKLNSRRGDVLIQGLVWLLIIFILFVGVMEFVRLQIISTSVRDAVEQAVTSVAINNAYNSYNGVREGNSGAYMLSGDDWRENISTADVEYKLTSLLHLRSADGGLVRMNPDGKTYEFKISGLRVTPDNANFASNEKKAKYQAACTLTVPLSLGFQAFPPVVVHMRHQSIYIALFE